MIVEVAAWGLKHNCRPTSAFLVQPLGRGVGLRILPENWSILNIHVVIDFIGDRKYWPGSSNTMKLGKH